MSKSNSQLRFAENRGAKVYLRVSPRIKTPTGDDRF